MVALAAQGFGLDHQTTWSVTMSAPAATVDALFGTRPTTGPHGVTTGPLPVVPAVLSTRVSAVYPTTGGPAAFRSLATSTLAGPDFRNADTGAGVPPSTGTKSGGVTVATLQLASFTASDLTTYAKNNGLADPVGSGAYKPVTVDGGPPAPTPPVVTSRSRSTRSRSCRPHRRPTRRRTSPRTPTRASTTCSPTSTTTWWATPWPRRRTPTSCPCPPRGVSARETTAENIAPLEPILKSLVAAGVTVFASAGDAGIYDRDDDRDQRPHGDGHDDRDHRDHRADRDRDRDDDRDRRPDGHDDRDRHPDHHSADQAPTARGTVTPMVVYVGDPVHLHASGSSNPEQTASRPTCT